jgi:ParB-like chromosome segregation protein Spo0J
MKIETVSVDQILAAPYNPRKDLQPGDPAYDALQRSIDQWGAVEPLVWNQRTGHLVGGHQRFKILKARGDSSMLVSVVDLDTTQEKALNIALNKIDGAWDDAKLVDALADLDIPDITLTGFSTEDLKQLAEAAVPAFTPAPAETIEVQHVTGADMTAAQKRIDGRFKGPKPTVEMLCPHCGKSFGVGGDDGYQQ